MKRKRRVSFRVFKFTLDLMGRHLKFEAARNSVFSSRNIHSCLLHLSLREGYTEGGMADLSSKCSLSSKVPTGRTLRNRVERVEAKEVRRSLNEANDEVLRTLKGLGVFRRRAVVADSQYSSENVRDLIEEFEAEPVIPYMSNQRRGEDVLRVDRRFRASGPVGEVAEYRKRPAVEALFEFLRTQFGLGVNRVRLLSVLCCALNREAAENMGRPEKALSPTFFNT
jgi:hypothetical protein